MSASLADWLALREPADAAARSAVLTDEVARRLPNQPLRIVDLGTGTGANVRYLSPRLPLPQHWTAVDRDRSVLAELMRQIPRRTGERPGFHIEPLETNVGRLEPRVFAGCHLVTASALLDLVSRRWLEALVRECRVNHAVVLFALTYNGQSSCEPAERDDNLVRDLMNRHQRANDKGFGIAAGPDATDYAEEAFRKAGYRTGRASSDWILPPSTQTLQRLLIQGWADAALEIAPDHKAPIDEWLGRRLAHVGAGRSRVRVGHDDVAAWFD